MPDLSKKDLLRRKMIELRSHFPSEERDQANESIEKAFFAHWKKSWNSILIYINQPDEAATIPIIRKLLTTNTKICVPAFDRENNQYVPSELKDFDLDLIPGQFKIWEPKAAAKRLVPIMELDTIFVPGLAFDRQGNRLGYGRGYFDRICQNTRAEKIGLAYDFQLVNELEPHPHDVAMNTILTEKEIIECRKL